MSQSERLTFTAWAQSREKSNQGMLAGDSKPNYVRRKEPRMCEQPVTLGQKIKHNFINWLAY